MITAVWNRLWDMHDETKALVLFSPKAMFKKFMPKNIHLSQSDHDTEHEVDLADETDLDGGADL